MNTYTLTNYWKNGQARKKLDKKALNEIDKRRLMAIKMNDLVKVEEYNNKVLEIIKKDGLENEEPRIRLDSAFKTLPYITPQKKAIEMTVTSKSIEDIIKEDIQDAEIISINTENKQNSDNVSK